MTAPHLTTRRDRDSKRFKALHRQLARELAAAEVSRQPTKTDSHRAKSLTFRQSGEVS